MNLLVLLGLLALPVYAVQRYGSGFYWLGVYALMVSAVTYWAYVVDKRRAEQGYWRLTEGRLHLLELLGGWPGAFLAQRRLHHKCSKVSYQIVFWLIVLTYQFAAYDSCHHWRYTQAGVNYLNRVAPQRR